MNDLFVALGIESWKPVLSTLLLPPVPLLVIVLLGAWMLARHRRSGWTVVWLGLLGLWVSTTAAAATWLERVVLRPPAALSSVQVQQLRDRVRAGRSVAIVVLGGGREYPAPEYGAADLGVMSIARLRYGLWLSRQTGAPVGFTGGVGHAADDGPAEAEIAANVAQREYGAKLRWIEAESRDTRENAVYTLKQLRRDGVDELVLVSHGWHLPRGLRNFERAAGADLHITLAPMGLAAPVEAGILRWLPTHQGFARMRHVTHELLGLLLGA